MTVEAIFPIHLTGRAVSAGASEVTAWPDTSILTAPTSPSDFLISSSSANDTEKGTGAQRVRIWCIDIEGKEITSTVELDGQTGVPVYGPFQAINRMEVLESGTGNSNVGDIYVGKGAITAGVPAEKYAMIATGDNMGNFLFYTVPEGFVLDIHRIEVAPESSSTTLKWKLMKGELKGTDKVWGTFSKTSAGEQIKIFDSPIRYYGGEILSIRTVAMSVIEDVYVNVTGILK
jgi:hypothetical protein